MISFKLQCIRILCNSKKFISYELSPLNKLFHFLDKPVLFSLNFISLEQIASEFLFKSSEFSVFFVRRSIAWSCWPRTCPPARCSPRSANIWRGWSWLWLGLVVWKLLVVTEMLFSPIFTSSSLDLENDRWLLRNKIRKFRNQ